MPGLYSCRWTRLREPGKALTVAYVDADDFKGINDRYGHAYGDEVLRSIANTLKQNLRETDSISRVGGDEFVILLPETDAEQAHAVLSKLQSVMAASMARFETKISVSVGAVVFDEPPLDVDALTKASDAAMYRAKANGKNGIFFHSFAAKPA